MGSAPPPGDGLGEAEELGSGESVTPGLGETLGLEEASGSGEAVGSGLSVSSGSVLSVGSGVEAGRFLYSSQAELWVRSSRTPVLEPMVPSELTYMMSSSRELSSSR